MKTHDGLTRRELLDGGLRIAAAGLTAPQAIASLARAGSPDQWQIGCYTRPWSKYDYRVAFDAIAEAGFKYVGLMTTKSESRLVISVSTSLDEADQIGREARKRGLEIPSVYGGGIPVDKSLEAGIAGLRKLIDNCAACKAGNLLMGGTGNEQLYARYYKAIAECCDYAEERGVGISIKPHGGLNATGPQCRKTIEMVNHRNFRIWYDPGNIFYYSDARLDPVDDAETVDGLVVGMCVKDYKHPKNVAVTPGTGMVDFAAVMAGLYEGGFRKGPLIIECLAPGDLDKTLSEAKKARLFVSDLAHQIPQSAAREPSPLLAGIAAVDITPPAGYRMSGYFRERLNTGIHDPLYAKALVLEQGGTRTAMVFCDIIGVPADVTHAVRRRVGRETDIPADSIMVAATHSHTGPLYCGALRKHFHDKSVAKHGHDPCEAFDYADKLTDCIVQAIIRANSGKTPIRLEKAVAQQQGLAFNRRFHMKDGSVRFNPGVKNPDIVKVAGPIDPDVGILFVRREDRDTPMAAIVNFALHLDTTGGTQYSADYPHYLEQALRDKYGSDFILMFATGTCGDINHIDVTKRQRLGPDDIGRELARTVAAANRDQVRGPMLSGKRETADVPLQQFNAEEVAWAKENIDKVGTRNLSFLEQVRAYKILDTHLRRSETIALDVQVFRLGPDLAVVGLPGEVFVDIGLAIKKASPFAQTLVIELCNDCPGYIPTQKAFAEGSYETVNSRIRPGGGEELMHTAIRLLKSLSAS